MKEITLKEFLEENTQNAAAIALGVGQSAIAQMVSSNRDIRFVMDARGEVINAYELKPLGKQPARASQRAA
ncbi:Cro/CI family transcriptional regulator [Marinihelvus fidelis]|uniref:Cro/CI family transcriptional regulator n=1 Tax=Marinihelvus fidelis TaxID=2613842 RepID=UPI0017855B80|nr:Cro/CI family transcriptional regulator [Marinihelvus fidelis]